MYTANYKFQLRQNVIAIDPKTKQFYNGIILQNHIDVYRESKDSQLITEVSYVVKITSGDSCTSVKTFNEIDLYDTIESAINANTF